MIMACLLVSSFLYRQKFARKKSPMAASSSYSQQLLHLASHLDQSTQSRGGDGANLLEPGGSRFDEFRKLLEPLFGVGICGFSVLEFADAVPQHLTGGI